MALKGIQVLEIAGLAPAPFCGMVLSDFGAKVIRIDKLVADAFGTDSILAHGKLSVVLNFKTSEGKEAFRKLSATSDVVIDPFRPGVMENLRLGPSDLMKTNNRLIYARLTGYGQEGPMAKAAGHDINYAAMSGALSFLGGRSEAPTPPVNLLADFAGGGLTAALGITMALFERQKSGRGQVVDCSMTRGAAYVSSWLLRGRNTFLFCNARGANLLDGGAFFYDTYKTKDGKWMAVGALEPKFFQNLLKGLGKTEEELSQTTDPQQGRLILTKAFAEHDQEHWVKGAQMSAWLAIWPDDDALTSKVLANSAATASDDGPNQQVFSDLDACVTPVLSPQEAAEEKHSQHQKNFDYFSDGTMAPAPEPRLSRTPAVRDGKRDAPRHGEHTMDILKSVGYTDSQLREMLEKRAISTPETDSKF